MYGRLALGIGRFSLRTALGSVVPAPGPTLGALTLAASSIQENAASGTVVGGVLGTTSGSTLSLVDAAGGRFAIAGSNLVAGATATDFEASASHQVTVRETLAGATNSPRDTVLTVTVTNVFEQPSLSALAFSGAGALRNGTAASGAITGATAGSTISAAGLPAGFTINGPARTWAFDGSAAAGTSNATLTETLADSANSPRATVLAVTIGAATLDFIWDGQSNQLNHFTTTASPPAASPNTFVWDNSANTWVTPVGNGIRTFLNAVAAATGKTCRAVYGGQSGVNIAALQKGAGTGYYETLMARVTASGISPAFIMIHHGEGDGNTASPGETSYQAALNTLHGDLVADIGKTRATCPMIVSSLATVNEASFTSPDTSWQTIKNALVSVNTSFPNIHYSHSNMDATLADGVHWNGASYGRSGARYARTVLALMGSVTTRPRWFATAADRVTATTTRITVVHGMGADFTPTSGITGFEVTGNNGSTWVSATGAREDATHIILTHADLGTVERKIRYQYGKAPSVTAPVVDDSGLANLLNYTRADLVAAGAVALPSITYAGANASAGTGASQSFTGRSVPGSAQALLAIIGHTLPNNGASYSSCSVTAQPSGTVITATLVEKQDPTSAATAPGAAIYQAELPSGTTSIDVTITMSANPFAAGRFATSTIPIATLTSTTKVGSGKQRTASATSATASLATAAGGVVFALGVDLSTTTGNTGSFTGTEAYAVRNNAQVSGGTHTVGDASGTSANASSTVTVTFGNAANTTVVAASWR